jgi:hypothetical protein
MSLRALLLLRIALDAQLQMLTQKTTNENSSSNGSQQPQDANPHTVAEAALSALDAVRRKDNHE